MKNKTVLLAFLVPLALGCPKSPGDSPSTPPPAPATHAATPVETPPSSGATQPAGEPAKPGEDAAPPGHQGGPAIGPSRGTMVRGLKECVDAELAQRNLNEFGDPKDTVYAGGTPLFDEPSGKSTDRVEHVFKKHPDIKTACVRPAP